MGPSIPKMSAAPAAPIPADWSKEAQASSNAYQASGAAAGYGSTQKTSGMGVQGVTPTLNKTLLGT